MLTPQVRLTVCDPLDDATPEPDKETDSVPKLVTIVMVPEEFPVAVGSNTTSNVSDCPA